MAKPNKTTKKKTSTSSTPTGISLGDIAETIKKESPDSSMSDSNQNAKVAEEVSAKVTANLEQIFLKDVLGSAVGENVFAKLMGTETAKKNIPDLIVSDKADDLPELLDDRVDGILQKISAIESQPKSENSRVQTQKANPNVSKKVKDQLTNNIFTKGKDKKEEKIPSLKDFLMGQEGDFTKRLFSNIFGKKFGAVLSKSILGDKPQEQELEKEKSLEKPQPTEEKEVSQEKPNLSEIVKQSVIEALDSKKIEVELPENILGTDPTIQEISSKVNDIHERISSKDITVGKGEDAQTFRYDPLAPEGMQVKQISEKTGMATARNASKADEQAVLGKAALLGSKMMERTPIEEAERIPEENVKEEAEKLKQSLSRPITGELKVTDKEDSEKDPVEVLSEKIDTSTDKIINHIDKNKKPSEEKDKKDKKPKEEKIPTLKEFLGGKPGDFQKKLLQNLLGDKFGKVMDKHINEKGGVLSALGFKKKNPEETPTTAQPEPNAENSGEQTAEIKPQDSKQEIDVKEKQESELADIRDDISQNQALESTFERDMIQKVDGIIERLEEMKRREEKEDSAEKDEDRRNGNSNKQSKEKNQKVSRSESTNQKSLEEKVKETKSTTEENEGGVSRMMKRFKGMGDKVKNVGKAVRGGAGRVASAARSGIGSAARGIGTVARAAGSSFGAGSAALGTAGTAALWVGGVAAAGYAGYKAGQWLNENTNIQKNIASGIDTVQGWFGNSDEDKRKRSETAAQNELASKKNKQLEGTGYTAVPEKPGTYRDPSGKEVKGKDLPQDIRQKMNLPPLPGKTAEQQAKEDPAKSAELAPKPTAANPAPNDTTSSEMSKAQALVTDKTSVGESRPQEDNAGQTVNNNTVVNNVKPAAQAPVVVTRNLENTISSYNASIFDHPVTHPGIYQM